MRELSNPINTPRGIKRKIVRDEGKSKTKGDEIIKPDRKDVQPKDVFDATPNFTGVRNFAETGKDLSNAIDNQIPKDKGYETVKNLSQFLIRTEGGGEGGPEGKHS